MQQGVSKMLGQSSGVRSSKEKEQNPQRFFFSSVEK
jgi:hypothetical protein